jgi:hypothetical protein
MEALLTAIIGDVYGGVPGRALLPKYWLEREYSSRDFCGHYWRHLAWVA